MNISKEDKLYLLNALETEQARLKRSMNAEKSQQIKEIHQFNLQRITELHGRVFNEVPK